MPEYTYRFANLLSDSDIAELELSNVKFDRRIIQPGSFTATIPVTNLDTASQVKKIVPARTVVHVYRDADIWGTYIIWQVRVGSSNRGPVTVTLSGATLESWLYKRIVDIDLTFDNVDQYDIARTLLDNAQTGWTPYEASANLGIIASTNDSGVLRDRTYLLSDAASVGQRLTELANVDNGFEYMIQTYSDLSLGYRVRKLVLAETLGEGYGDVVFSYPGSILAYDITYDAADAATAFWARGDTIDDDITDASQPLITPAPALSAEYLENAFPHLDKVVDYSSVSLLTTLEDYALWWMENRAGVWAVPVVTINTVDVPTIITPNTLGSSAQFTIEDEFFGRGDFSYEGRVVGIEVTPPERDQSEEIRLVIEQSFDPTDTGD